jgi:hypothetical protein
MSVGDFGTFNKILINPLITLTDVGTLASGQADNGANHINAIVYAFWFILGDAIVGFFYTDAILSGPGGSNVVFQLNFTNQWGNGFRTLLRFYTREGGFHQGVVNPVNHIYEQDGNGYLNFLANNFGNTADKDAVALIIFKADS